MSIIVITIRPDMASLPVRLTGPIRRCIGSFAKGFSRPIGAVPTATTGSLASHARDDKLIRSPGPALRFANAGTLAAP